MDAKLIISFPDQSKSFTYGVEYGRILQQIEQGNLICGNNGFPVRVENIDLLRKTCEQYGYIPNFGPIYFKEWVDFTAIKNTQQYQ